MRYYDGLYDTVAAAEASGNPTRTWVIKTNENGYCDLDARFLVSGDAFYTTPAGEVTLPVGTVLIQETKAPEGYFINDEVYLRQVTATGTTEDVNTYNAPVTPEQVLTGNIQITKTTRTGLDKHVVAENGAVFEIYLKSAGSYADAAETDRALLTTDANGVATAEDLPYGTYTVHQVSGWEGSALCDDFDVTIDTNGKTYSYDIENERFYSKVQLVKLDSRTGLPIPEANVGFQIKYPNGSLVSYNGADTWYTDSTGALTLPMELEYGKVYQAIELNAPDGYVLSSTPINFDVTADAATSLAGETVILVDVNNTPTSIQVSKVDVDAKGVSGAKLQVLSSTGAVVDEWTSDGTVHMIYALSIGGRYTLHEVAAPAGYVLAKDVTFTVADTTDIQPVSMIDKQVFIEKLDAEGNSVSGATLQILDSKGDVVDEWVSNGNPHAANNLVIGKSYTLRESAAPAGYVRAADISFTVEDDGKNQSYTVTDKQVMIEKVDADGNGVSGAKLQLLDADGNVVDEWTTDGKAHAASNLDIGESYTLHEAETPDGYVTANDVSFSVTVKSATQTVSMTDTKLLVEKVDPYGNAVQGATLQVLDDKGNVIDEWVTDGTAYAVTGLSAGKSYVLHESAAPEGWLLAYDFPFTVEDDGLDQTVRFENEEIPLLRSMATVDDRHEAFAKADVMLIDVVEYEKLVPGREYVMKGTLMDKETGKALLNEDGEAITSSVIFTPAASTGSVDVTFTYTPVAGSTVVVFQQIYKDDRLLASHEDLNDENQTVRFPAIDSSATVNEKKSITRTAKMTLVDVVTYANLTIGKEYTVKGVLMDERTGEVFVAKKDAEPITVSVTFTPETADGSVSLTFELLSSHISRATTLVVFDELYDSEYLVAEHKDITDEDQTVKIRIPIRIIISEKTGDLGIEPYAALAATSFLGSCLLIRRRREKSK